MKKKSNNNILLSKYGIGTVYSSEYMYTTFAELVLKIEIEDDLFSFLAQTQPAAEFHLETHNNATYCLPFIAK